VGAASPRRGSEIARSRRRAVESGPTPLRYGPALTNFEYAPLAEQMGRVHWSSEVFNCHAPVSGNMGMLERYDTEQQIADWLPGMADGTHGSAFARRNLTSLRPMRPTFAPASNATATTMQIHGAAGVTDDFGLGYAYARARIMRYVDGPEEVHRNTIARMELAKHR